jgi:hypothetical protein
MNYDNAAPVIYSWNARTESGTVLPRLGGGGIRRNGGLKALPALPEVLDSSTIAENYGITS